MGSLLSTLSKPFGKALILGTLLPVLLWLATLAVVLPPLLPLDRGVFEDLLDLKAEAQVASLSLLTLILTGLLYIFNADIVSLFQGVGWKDSWIGKSRVRRYQAKIAAAKRWRRVLRPIGRRLQRKDPNDSRIDTIEDWRRDLSLRINHEFPESYLILPTQLGNVIRNVDEYPRRQYGISGATLTPRIASQIDAGYLTKMDEAKSNLDFMINASFLSLVTVLVLLLAGLGYQIPLATPGLAILWLVKLILFILLFFLCYRGSISRAKAWGTIAKGAFDLYRWGLLKQLGYQQMPESLEEERALWRVISKQMIHGDPPAGVDTGRLGVYIVHQRAKEPTLATSKEGKRLEVARGVAARGQDGTLDIVVRIVNEEKETATGVVLLETLPEGFEYAWGSARIHNKTISVLGTNPFRFRLGDLAGQAEMELRYQASPRSYDTATLQAS